MSKKRQRHRAEFKAKVALEAVKGIQTLQQLAKDLQVHPTPDYSVEETTDGASGASLSAQP